MKENKDKKEEIILIVLCLILSGLIVGSICVWISLESSSKNESLVKTYKYQAEKLQEENDNQNMEIAGLWNKSIQRENELNKLYSLIMELECDTNLTIQKIKDLNRKYEGESIYFKIILGLLLGSNIALGVDAVLQYNKLGNLKKVLTDIKINYTAIKDKIHTVGSNYMIDALLLRSAISVIQILKYQATRDGFSVKVLQDAVCGTRNNIVIITTAGGYEFGLILRAVWICNKNVIADEAKTFTLDNFAIANITKGQEAIVNDRLSLLNIGDGEIIIWENKTGNVNPGKNFNITQPYIPEKFYTPERFFTVKEIEIYNASFRSP